MTGQCHFCGTYVSDGFESNGSRHWLSDCRPDLVEHEPGDLCTWPASIYGDRAGCYAYMEDWYTPGVGSGTRKTDNHTHFYADGPMA